MGVIARLYVALLMALELKTWFICFACGFAHCKARSTERLRNPLNPIGHR